MKDITETAYLNVLGESQVSERSERRLEENPLHGQNHKARKWDELGTKCVAHPNQGMQNHPS